MIDIDKAREYDDERFIDCELTYSQDEYEELIDENDELERENETLKIVLENIQEYVDNYLVNEIGTDIEKLLKGEVL